MKLSENLRIYREASRLSQDEVAEALGISRQTISNWENEKTEPDIRSLAALAKLYGKTMEELLYGDSKETPEKRASDPAEVAPEAPPAMQSKPKKKAVLLIVLAVLLVIAISFAAGWYAHAYVQSRTVNEMQVDLSEPHDTLELLPLEEN